MPLFQIDNYKIIYYSPCHDENYLSTAARITLYRGQAPVGDLFFIKDEEPMPPRNLPLSPFRIYFPLSHFDTIMSILRNEKPLYANITSTGYAYIGTTQYEPVGEEEGV
ncbi:MAG: hypothetical protein HZC48_07235 [Nitrospirae bacterium]|nr:hypothetical protein [Nitrospirota bacterium]